MAGGFIEALSKLNTTKLHSMSIPDWDVEPKAEKITALGKVFYALPLSLALMTRAKKYARGSLEEDRVYTLIFSLLDKDSELELSVADKPDLMLSSPSLITSVHSQIMEVGANVECSRTVYFRMATLSDHAEARKLSDGDQYAFNAHIFILKALDEDGKQLFTEDDFDRVMSMNVEVLNPFIREIGEPRGRESFLE